MVFLVTLPILCLLRLFILYPAFPVSANYGVYAWVVTRARTLPRQGDAQI